MIGLRYHILNIAIFVIYVLDINKFFSTYSNVGFTIDMNSFVWLLVAGMVFSKIHPMILRKNLSNPLIQMVLLMFGFVGYLIQP